VNEIVPKSQSAAAFMAKFPDGVNCSQLLDMKLCISEGLSSELWLI